MTKKGEKFASLSISLLEPPRIQMTCSTSNFRLETFSPNINDKNYLHLPPPTPDFALKQDNNCYTDIPMYAMAIATNKHTCLFRDCSLYGSVFFESDDIGRFSSAINGLVDFIVQPNETIFVPFQVKIPHAVSAISSQTKVSRSASCLSTEIGSSQEASISIKPIVINSFFNFRVSETNQKMQIALVEKINIKSSVSISYKFSNPISNKDRLPLFQVVLKNHYDTFLRNVEIQTMDPNPHSSIPIVPKNSDSYGNPIQRKKNGRNVIKLGDFIGPGEVACGYISHPDLFNLMDVYFSLPFCHFCNFSEPILASLGFSPKSNQKQINPPSRQSVAVKDHKKTQQPLLAEGSALSPNRSSPYMPTNTAQTPNKSQASLYNRPLMTIPPKSSQLQSPNFQVNLNKLPKAVQTLRPFTVQLQIINTNKKMANNNGPTGTNDTAKPIENGVISGSVSLAESESIFLFGNNNLTIPNILPGQSYVLVISLIALKQGKFPFPTITVRLKNYRNTQVDFDTGVIAIGCNE